MTISPRPMNSFPIGYYPLHKMQMYNYNLNRWHSLGFTRLEDLKSIGKEIKNFADWKRVMIRLAERAVAEKRVMNAAFYFRAATFFLFNNDEEKEWLYDRFQTLFHEATHEDAIEWKKIPYSSGTLLTLKIPACGTKKGTILLHGGFDSYIEEWYYALQYFASAGYDAIGYEGPGQGQALIKHKLPFDIQWEKPLKAILDYFQVTDGILVGLSLGGWLAIRAAAFEPRIKRVVTSGHSIGYMLLYPPFIRKMHLWLLSKKNWRPFMNRMGGKKMQANNMQGWMTNQLMHITQKINDPMDAFDTWIDLNEYNISADKVTQDILVCAGENDHIIPIRMHQLQLDALTHARSVTSRIFTKSENAQNHCQIGNIPLLLDTILDWLKSKDP